MPLISTEAIVLQSYPYSETSKILRLLTHDFGVRSVIARGALRPRSQYGGVLEPFSIGTATIYLKEGRDLHTLSGFDLSRTGQALGRDLVRFGIASLVAELVLRTGSEEGDQALYDQVFGALGRIETASPEILEGVGLAEVWALIGRLGYAPIVDYCLGCERELEESEASTFDYPAGGTRCSACARAGGGSGRELPPAAREALAQFVRGRAVHLDRTGAHWALLARFLAYHLSDGGTIRSVHFLIDTLDIYRCAG
jgi:DNA repair protein RecO (recombination protein O)